MADLPAFLSAPPAKLTLSDDEARELYQYTSHDYINPNKLPALHKLMARLSRLYGPRL